MATEPNRRTKLENIKKLYQRTPPFPCNWAQLLCMFAEMKYLETTEEEPVPSTSLGSDATTGMTSTTDEAPTENLTNEVESVSSLYVGPLIPLEQQQRQLQQLNQWIQRLRKRSDDFHHQKFVDSLQRLILTKEFEPCTLCLELPSVPVLTPCGHIYCKACIQEVLVYYARKAFCPVCREPMGRDNILEIPLFKVVEVKPFPWPWNWGKKPLQLALPPEVLRPSSPASSASSSRNSGSSSSASSSFSRHALRKQACLSSTLSITTTTTTVTPSGPSSNAMALEFVTSTAVPISPV